MITVSSWRMGEYKLSILHGWEIEPSTYKVEFPLPPTFPPPPPSLDPLPKLEVLDL